MLLWVSFAILTAAVVAYLLRPLRQAKEQTAVAPEAADLAVYRDQLKELEAERERGLIAEGELESARTEVARRLIKRAGEESETRASTTTERAARTHAQSIYTAVAALLPLAGIVVYLALGSPHLPGQPFAAREAPTKGEPAIAALIKKVEDRLAEHPEDGKGWDVIAPIYLRLGKFPEAAHAYAEANRLEGETPRRLIGFSEATLMAEKGIVTEPVRITARRILELDADAIQPRIWLALGREQDGDLNGAAADYRKLLTGAPDDVPWRDAVAERLMLVEARLKGEDVDAKPAERSAKQASPSQEQDKGPTAADVAAMSREEQDAFVMGMVDRLAARLKEDPQDLQGWMRLARAYKVIGRDDDARSAISRARETFASDDEALKKIAGAEDALGLGTKEEKTTQ